MKNAFVKPSCEVVKFGNSVIVTSTCSCFYEYIGEDLGSDETCTGANVSCSCKPNYDDPSANCD